MTGGPKNCKALHEITTNRSFWWYYFHIINNETIMTAQGNNNECIYKIDYLNNEPIISNIFDRYQAAVYRYHPTKPKVTFFWYKYNFRVLPPKWTSILLGDNSFKLFVITKYLADIQTLSTWASTHNYHLRGISSKNGGSWKLPAQTSRKKHSKDCEW